jgi:tRNA pseudouridine38-40 synthase
VSSPARPVPLPPADAHGVLLTVAYDGAGFSGFAPQPEQRTVYGELLRAIRAVDASVAEIRGASRTDAGVHARGQRVAFDARLALPSRAWVLALIPHLPDDVAVVRAASVATGFAPRFEATRKLYRYVLLRSAVPDPFLRGRAWRIAELGDAGVAAMQREAAALVGTHDFAAFRSSADQRTSTVRTIERLDVSAGGATVNVSITGDGFLHNMVRIVVGTLVDVGLERVEAGACARALCSKRREHLGRTAPPDGLCLERVWLRDEGASAWPEPGV